MSENAKKLTLKGLFWNAADRFGYQIIVTLVGVIMARILPVSDFSVIAVLTIFSTVATSFVDSGLATSLVRTKEVTSSDYSSMFVFNLFSSLLLYLILFCLAPYIENIYEIPNLALYARVLFLQIIVHAFGIVQYVKVLKNSQFNVTAKVNVISVFLSGVIAVLLAYIDFGIWVLILQPILYSLFRTFMLWFWGDWKFNFHLSISSIKRHLEFSLTFMFSNMIGKILAPLYSSFIGKYYSQVQTGYHYQANKWGETPNMLISSIIQGTTLSTLTPLQDDYPRYLNACRKSMSTLAFVLFPVTLFSISAAEPGFIFVLGQKYRDAVVYFQLICFAGLFISLSDLNVNFINIKGKSKYALLIEVVKLCLGLFILYFTYNKGILLIIYGQLVVRVVCYILSSIFSKKVYGYYLGLQLNDLMPSFVVSAIAAVFSYMPLYFRIADEYIILIFLQGIVFIVVYFGLHHLIKHTIWVELLQLIKSKLK